MEPANLILEPSAGMSLVMELEMELLQISMKLALWTRTRQELMLE